MYLKIVMDLDNDAFEGDAHPEIKRILLNAIKLIEEGYEDGNLIDINGNSVGHYIIEGR